MHITNLWAAIKTLLQRPPHQDIEDYLSRSVDIFDLEARIQQLARKGIL